MIHFENVGLRYGAGPEVLRDVNFHFRPGSFHFLMGTSGAGKTSLLRLMYLAHRPSRGTVRMFGHDVNELNRDELCALRRRVGVVFQDFRLLDHMSVRDNVALPLRLAGVNEARIKSNVEELLTWVGLAANMEAPPSMLSGGEQQRVAIARAVIAKPSVLLADEPTGNVDDGIGLRLMRLFEELHRTGTTVVVATHNQLLVERMGYPALLVDKGVLSAKPARLRQAV